jgi:hypothetical protein
LSVKAILYQLELSFWDAFIPLMDRSPSARYLLPRVYRVLHIKEFQHTIKLTFLLSILGLLLGFVLGALPQI